MLFSLVPCSALLVVLVCASTCSFPHLALPQPTPTLSVCAAMRTYATSLFAVSIKICRFLSLPSVCAIFFHLSTSLCVSPPVLPARLSFAHFVPLLILACVYFFLSIYASISQWSSQEYACQSQLLRNRCVSQCQRGVVFHAAVRVILTLFR